MTATPSEPTLYRYALPNVNWEGWAVVLLTSNGMLAVASDFGNYVHHWPPEPGDFRAFLLQCDDGYLTRKLSGGHRVVDGQRTAQGIREQILHYRREGFYTREFARKEWDLCNSADFGSEWDLHDWYRETDLEDAYDLVSHDAPPQLVGFMEHVWPRFRAALQAELGEAAVAAS